MYLPFTNKKSWADEEFNSLLALQVYTPSSLYITDLFHSNWSSYCHHTVTSRSPVTLQEKETLSPVIIIFWLMLGSIVITGESVMHEHHMTINISYDHHMMMN